MVTRLQSVLLRATGPPQFCRSLTCAGLGGCACRREDESTGKTRIGCSVKLANQREGTDLDPHGINYQPRPDGGFGGRAPVGAQAGGTAKGKVDWGHHAGDVKQMGGKKGKYDMVESDDDGDCPDAPQRPGEGLVGSLAEGAPPESNLAPVPSQPSLPALFACGLAGSPWRR